MAFWEQNDKRRHKASPGLHVRSLFVWPRAAGICPAPSQLGGLEGGCVFARRWVFAAHPPKRKKEKKKRGVTQGQGRSIKTKQPERQSGPNLSVPLYNRAPHHMKRK